MAFGSSGLSAAIGRSGTADGKKGGSTPGDTHTGDGRSPNAYSRTSTVAGGLDVGGVGDSKRNKTVSLKAATKGRSNRNRQSAVKGYLDGIDSSIDKKGNLFQKIKKDGIGSVLYNKAIDGIFNLTGSKIAEKHTPKSTYEKNKAYFDKDTKHDRDTFMGMDQKYIDVLNPVPKGHKALAAIGGKFAFMGAPPLMQGGLLNMLSKALQGRQRSKAYEDQFAPDSPERKAAEKETLDKMSNAAKVADFEGLGSKGEGEEQRRWLAKILEEYYQNTYGRG